MCTAPLCPGHIIMGSSNPKPIQSHLLGPTDFLILLYASTFCSSSFNLFFTLPIGVELYIGSA